MKKKFPMAPVRANVRGMCAVHLISIVALPPGPTARGSGTCITVPSSAFPSSGEMKHRARGEVRSRIVLTLSKDELTDVHARPFVWAAGRIGRRASVASRSQVDRVSRHAFQ